PFSQKVVESNRLDQDWPSAEWLHARIEGQRLIGAVQRHLIEQLQASGFEAVAPSLHPQFASWNRRPLHSRQGGTDYSSNWSERHVAHAAGLGTFGLSAALITSLGVAGRLGSVVTNLELPATSLPYQVFDEYCLHCGVCARNCRCLAISPGKGKKDKQICSAFLEITRNRYRPRYGCGKCYVNVPCERINPKAAGRRS
ncbi:MAG: epoxyqueuosine reductase, partial [Planctomycetota bacterium]|nr:epoxyqueuosine reductase [Planctomycetota bacterium]